MTNHADHLEGYDVLIVEDESLLRKRLAAYLQKQRARVIPAANLREAENCLASEHLDFVLLDLNLPDGDGLDLLRDHRISATTNVVIMTAEGGVRKAVEAMRLGASDYLTKPFDPEELPLVLHRCRHARQQTRLQEHREGAERQREGYLYFEGALLPIKEQLEKIIAADQRLATNLPPILIEGETGTGKTTIARWLHYHGPRATKPLVELNCSTLTDTLAESELFGHEQGAFTDARSARIGLFEAAEGGTLFLDEIPSLSPANQSKVLTAIEDRTLRRLGSNRVINVDVRLIAATNQDLTTLAASKQFREDLYHRLNLFRVRLPPLRDCRGDILRLAAQLLQPIGRRYGVTPAQISDRGAQRLLSYAWPGNVRELAHELERAVVLGDSAELDFAHLRILDAGDLAPTASRQDYTNDWFNDAWQFPSRGFDLDQAINRLIQHALKQTGDNVSAAARLLNVSRDYLRYRLPGKHK